MSEKRLPMDLLIQRYNEMTMQEFHHYFTGMADYLLEVEQELAAEAQASKMIAGVDFQESLDKLEGLCRR